MNDILILMRRIADAFSLDGEILEAKVISNGHINNTYAVTLRLDGKDECFVFQRINVFVFKKPRLIMENIELVTRHVEEKLALLGRSRDEGMHFLYTPQGENFCENADGFWRISEYVPDSVTVNFSEDPNVLRSAGRAFGRFQTMLSDFDATKLHETIPHFHDTRSRIEQLWQHVKEDPCKRVSEVTHELERIRALSPTAVRLNELVDRGELTYRVTHNDTKINNVLFDAITGEAKTVIDLDTVMPGLVAHDFGDAIRFGASTAAEDEPDLSKVSLDMDRFRAYAEGFIGEVRSSLTRCELETLALGAFTMTLELVVRFLDDYLTGDQYFKTAYPGHNLVRARCQLALAEDMLEKLDAMNRIVSEIAGFAF